MGWRRRESETDKFVVTLLKSGLLDKLCVLDARRAVKAKTESSTELENLCSHLVSNGLITQWQCDKLRVGKHRGFFVDEYKIVDHIGKDYVSTTYMAVNIKSGERIGLRFTWFGGGGRPMEYDLVDLESE